MLLKPNIIILNTAIMLDAKFVEEGREDS